ncbi:MAG: hypothetical protein WC637_15700, partial [Victivallales bacterium]
MKFTDKTKAYEIDLSLPECKRWLHVMVAEEYQMKKMLREAKMSADKEVRPLPEAGIRLMKAYVSRAYKSSGGRYVGEVESMADFLGESINDLLALQCSFELTQFCLAFPYAHPALTSALGTMGTLYGKVFGCTSGI